jgi:hypothetical protein
LWFFFLVTPLIFYMWFFFFPQIWICIVRLRCLISLWEDLYLHKVKLYNFLIDIFKFNKTRTCLYFFETPCNYKMTVQLYILSIEPQLFYLFLLNLFLSYSFLFFYALPSRSSKFDVFSSLFWHWSFKCQWFLDLCSLPKK